MHDFRQSGFILFSTLSMIIIISLLLLTQMQQIMLYTKALGQEKEKSRDLAQIENIMEQLIQNKSLKDNRDCMLEQDEPEAVLHQTEKKGCRLPGNPHYQFLIEDLGIANCLLIKQGRQLFASYHRRFSLIYQKPEVKNYLQIRLIESSGMEGSCAKRAKIIRAGFRGWRFGIL